MSKIRVKVVEGICQGGYHRIGDEWEIDVDDALTPQGVCLGVFGAVFPYVMILVGNGEFYWEASERRTQTRIHCVDPKGIIVEIQKTDS